MLERLFYCGSTPPPRDVGRAIELRLAGVAANINRRIEDIEKRMVSEVPDHLRDLLDIATYVFVADRMIGRGGKTFPGMGREWGRRFRLFVAVRQPERWNTPEMKSALEDLVGFLSGDDYRFQFLKSEEPPAYPSRLPLGSENAVRKRHDQVMLFSGGLDSLAGAVQELSLTDDRIVLVSHRSSDRVFSRQKDLAGALSTLFPERVLHVPVDITMKQELDDVEFTQRTRTFLFSAIGCVVAEMMGCARIRFFENGIMSFNLPIAPQVVGSRATRSTHPLALRQMTEFINQALGHPFEAANPFVWRTKAEVVGLIESYGQAELIASSISCTHHVRKKGQRAHCGECAQCLHRRLGVLAAGLGERDPLGRYDVELLIDDRKDGEPRSLALNLVSNALEYPRLTLSGFMNRYAGEVLVAAKAFSDETIEDAVQRTYELHCRYGNEVGKVIDDSIRQYAVAIREHTLPPGCLLRAVITDHRSGLDRTPLVGAFPSESSTPAQGEADARDFRHTSRIELALDRDRKQAVIDGLGDVGTSAQFELVAFLAEQHRADVRAELKPENHAFIPTATLMDQLGVDSEITLRKRISEFRKSVAKLALTNWGIPLDRNAVIENRSGGGYRLNPSVVIIDTKELG
jgi:7-cyano-7-deazaguanine synthase in queuosine biosynthesis